MRPSRYSDAGQLVIASGRDEVPYGFEGLLGGAYLVIGQPERWVELCRAQLARGRDTHAFTRACLVIALTVAGSADEAMAAAKGLIDAAEATRNPYVLSFALLAYGLAFRDADPDRALEALRRGLVIAQDSGNRVNESHLAAALARLEAEYGDPMAAFDYFTLAIRNYHDAGNTTMIRTPLAVLAAFFDRLGRYEPAATIAGFAVVPRRSVRSRNQHRDRPPARGPRRPDLRIARPQGRGDDHRRHGDLRIRPNRPGPSRTERGLGIDPNETPVGAIGGHVRNLRPTAAPTGVRAGSTPAAPRTSSCWSNDWVARFSAVPSFRRSHHSAAHHPLHHRGHALGDEAGDFPSVGADGLREVGIVGGFDSDHARGGEGDLAVVVGGAAEQGRQALAHTHDFAALVKMRIHARHVLVEEGGEVGRVGFCRRAHTTRDLLDVASDLLMAAEHLHIHAHVHAGRTAESGAVGVRDHIRQRVQPRYTDDAAQGVPHGKKTAARAQHRQHLPSSQ